MEDGPPPLDLRRKKAEKRGPSDVEDLIASHVDSLDADSSRQVPIGTDLDAIQVNHSVMGMLEMEECKLSR